MSGYSKSVNYGSLIKSIVRDTAETMLHVGSPSNSFVKSVMEAMPEMDVWASDSEDDLDGVVELTGSIKDDDEYIYDIVAIEASVDIFSTAMYIALESALVEGGLAIIHGDRESMDSRVPLLTEMMREGTIAPFAFSTFVDRGIMIFVSNGVNFVRSM